MGILRWPLSEFFSGANAVADDTEIYFGASTAGTIRPNILFIMDTSGSMSTTVSGTTKSRLQTMQEALTDILDSVDNVNVGLMRYSAPSNTDNNGGPVLYPVKYIDDPAVEPAISATVSAASDDASEAIASPFDVVLNETCLPLSTATASAAPGAGELINGVAVALPSAAKDNLKYYTINVPTGTTNLTVTTTGGTGDADLFCALVQTRRPPLMTVEVSAVPAMKLALSTRLRLVFTMSWFRLGLPIPVLP